MSQILFHLFFLVIISVTSTVYSTRQSPTTTTTKSTSAEALILKTRQVTPTPLASSTDNCDVVIDIGTHYNCTSLRCLRFIPKFKDRTCIRIHNNLTSVPLAHVINFVDVNQLSITGILPTTKTTSTTGGLKKGICFLHSQWTQFCSRT